MQLRASSARPWKWAAALCVALFKFVSTDALAVDGNTLRVLVNYETADASISEVNLDLVSLQTAIDNMNITGNTGGVSFVNSARQAYEPDTFGADRGFVDHVYINGEEGGAAPVRT